MKSIKKLLPLIHRRMAALDINQDEVGRYLRLQQPSISRRLSGQTRFTHDELEKLDALLGLEAAALAEEKHVDHDQGCYLLQELYKQLPSERGKELLFLAATYGEGKLPDPIKSQICDALRLLSHMKMPSPS